MDIKTQCVDKFAIAVRGDVRHYEWIPLAGKFAT
jgi:hypothetical protein